MSENKSHNSDPNNASKYNISFSANEKNMLIGYLFWWFLGFVGAHRFYLDRPVSAVIMIVLAILGFFTFFVTWIILGFWWLIDGYFVYKYIIDYNNFHNNSPSLGFTFSSNNIVNGIFSDGSDKRTQNQKLDTLERLSKLRDVGAITETEFLAEKKKLLN